MLVKFKRNGHVCPGFLFTKTHCIKKIFTSKERYKFGSVGGSKVVNDNAQHHLQKVNFGTHNLQELDQANR